jgi:hypothetical protein
MKKFINHIDHVVWLSRLENAEKNVADLEAITDGNLVRFDRDDMQVALFIDWDAGLEVVAPFPAVNDFNRALHERLESHGEGLLAAVFGVENLEKHKENLEAKGMFVGPLMEDTPDVPWIEKIILRERFAPEVAGSWMVLSEIDYQDDVIAFVDVKEKVAG